jgi:exopolysaccharide production protein ExoY
MDIATQGSLAPQFLEPSLGRRAAHRVRIGLDQLGALVLLVLLSPVMGLIALFIWRTDGAPILFEHYRVGRHGRLFRCLKFRSMRRDAQQRLAALLRDDEAARSEWQKYRKLANDPRVTPIGRFLRRTSLDELPQLFNVLRGEMALVGPRPITVAELTLYGPGRWHYLSVPPGLTGLWQVSGRSNTTYSHRVNLDCHYVEQRSLWMDMQILFKTIKVVALREGAT